MWFAVWLLLFCGLNAVIAWFDLQARRVPNRLLLLAFGLQSIWLLANVWMPALPPEWQDVILARWPPALIGAGVALFLLFPLWRYRAMGAGDVKFAACLGFCIGLWGLLQAFLIASLIAGVHSLAFYVWRILPDGTRPFGIPYIPRSTPYAAYLAIGVLFGLGWHVLHGEPWLTALMGRP